MRISLVPPRSREPEILDRPGHTYEDLAAALRDIGKVNRWLGGNASLVRPLLHRALSEGLSSFTLLDVGTGGGDVPRAAIGAAERRGLVARVVGVDLDPQIVRYAASLVPRRVAAETRALSGSVWIRARPPAGEEPAGVTHAAGIAGARSGRRGGVSPLSLLSLLRADAFALPFSDGAFDFVACSLFLHHFREEEAARLLAEFARVARRGVFVNDLARNLIPWAAIRLLSSLLAESPMFKNDAPLSVLRGWTPRELLDLAAAAGLGGRARLVRRAPWRLVLVIGPGEAR